MTRNYFSTLNARLVAIHFVAFILFIYGFLILSLIHDYKFLQPNAIRSNILNNPPRFNKDMKFVELFGNIGLIVAYILSWTIANKRGWYWLSGALAFVLAFILKITGLLQWERIQDALQAPKKVSFINTLGGFIVIGAVLLLIGLFLFYGKQVVAYIEKAKPTTVKRRAPAPKKNVKGKR